MCTNMVSIIFFSHHLHFSETPSVADLKQFCIIIILTGLFYFFRVRVFDLRSEDLTHQFPGHSSQVNTVQMDEVKAISGGDDGFVRVWDLRMVKKLWEIHNR